MDTDRELDGQKTDQVSERNYTGEMAAHFPDSFVCKGVGTEVE